LDRTDEEPTSMICANLRRDNRMVAASTSSPQHKQPSTKP
jgi:hypothetical protein